MLTCLSRIDQVIKFLTGPMSQSGAVLFFPPYNPDSGVFSVSLELNAADNSVSYATASFYPIKDGTCSSSYEVIQYYPKECSSFQASLAPKEKPMTVKKEIGVIGIEGVKIFLLPSGKGCTVVKKEIIN